MTKQAEKNEFVRLIFQGLISVIIILGGFVFLFSKPESSATVTPLVTIVVSYYFLETNRAKTIKRTVEEMEAQKAKP